MSASRLVIPTGMAVILATLGFCASYMILSAVFRFLGLALAMARSDFGTGDVGLDVGLKIFMNAGLLSLPVALIFTVLAGVITFVFVIQLQKSKA